MQFNVSHQQLIKTNIYNKVEVGIIFYIYIFKIWIFERMAIFYYEMGSLTLTRPVFDRATVMVVS